MEVFCLSNQAWISVPETNQCWATKVKLLAQGNKGAGEGPDEIQTHNWHNKTTDY